MGICLFIYIKIYRIPIFRHLYLPYKSSILKYLHCLANYLFKRDHINPIKKGFIYVNIGKMKIMLKNKYKYKKIKNEWVLGDQGGGQITCAPETIKFRASLKALITSKWHKSYLQMN